MSRLLAALALAALMSTMRTSAAQESDVRRDEVVVFFPAYGYRVDAAGTWELCFHGWIFEPERRGLVDFVLKRLEIDAHALDAASRAILSRRAAAFVVDNERAKHIWIRLGEQRFALDASAPNGHFFGKVRLAAGQVEKLQRAAGPAPGPTPRPLRFEAVLSPGDVRTFRGEVWPTDATGVSVITDIDDTIKISDVADRAALLRNTFLRPYAAVPGMPETYQAWAANNAAAFHYVSASPWQLFEPLAEFVADAKFPAGTFHLKIFRWKDESFFDLFGDPREYKLRVIGEILAKFPQRRFVLVGDAGEQDPEAYAELARRHAAQIVRIFIRDLTPPEQNAARLRALADGLPAGVWQVFRDAGELPRTIP